MASSVIVERWEIENRRSKQENLLRNSPSQKLLAFGPTHSDALRLGRLERRWTGHPAIVLLSFHILGDALLKSSAIVSYWARVS